MHAKGVKWCNHSFHRATKRFVCRIESFNGVKSSNKKGYDVQKISREKKKIVLVFSREQSPQFLLIFALTKL